LLLRPRLFYHSPAYLPLVVFLLYLFFISSFIYLFDKYCIKLAANVNTKYAAPTAIIRYISFLNLDILFISFLFHYLSFLISVITCFKYVFNPFSSNSNYSSLEFLALMLLDLWIHENYRLVQFTVSAYLASPLTYERSAPGIFCSCVNL